MSTSSRRGSLLRTGMISERVDSNGKKCETNALFVMDMGDSFPSIRAVGVSSIVEHAKLSQEWPPAIRSARSVAGVAEEGGHPRDVGDIDEAIDGVGGDVVSGRGGRHGNAEVGR